MKSVAGAGSRLRTKLAAVAVGIAVVGVGILLASVQTWAVATDVDCPYSPCYARGRPYIGIGIFLIVVGFLGALVVWTSGREQAGPPRYARPPRRVKPSDPPWRHTW